MVGSFYFGLHPWLAGLAGRNKLLINMKAHLQRCAFCFAFGSGFRVQGSRFKALVAASPPFFKDGNLVSQPSPLGEGAPQGRIG